MHSLFYSLQSGGGWNACDLSWLWLLLPLLTFILGYLVAMSIWRKYKGLLAEAEDKLRASRKKIAQLEEDLAACKKRRAELDGELSQARGEIRELKRRLEEESRANMKKASAAASATAASSLAASKPKAPANAPAKSSSGDSISAESLAEAKAIFGKRIKANDLKIVEGIGPKIEGLFHAAGIKTWAKLADTKATVLKGILDEAGPRFQMHKPDTWPRQADMAAKGQWKKLLAYQDELDGGKA